MSTRVILFVAVIALVLGTSYAQGGILDMAIKALTGIVSSLFSAAIGAINTGSGAVASILGTVISSVVSLLGSVINAPVAVIQMLLAPISGLLTAVTNGVSGLMDALANAIGVIMNSIVAAGAGGSSFLVGVLLNYLTVVQTLLNVVFIPLSTIGLSGMAALDTLLIHFRIALVNILGGLVGIMCRIIREPLFGAAVGVAQGLLANIASLVSSFSLPNCTLPVCTSLSAAIQAVTTSATCPA